MAIEQGNRWKACMLFYIIKEYDRAILSIIMPLSRLLEEYNEENGDICCLKNGYWGDAKKLPEEIEQELLLDPIIYTLYRELIAYRPLVKESYRKHISKYLPGFILQSSSRYESIGMYDIAFTLARHIMYENSGHLFILEYAVKNAGRGKENALITANSVGDELDSDQYIPSSESDIGRGQFWNVISMDVDKETKLKLPTISSLAKLTLWRLALKLIKVFNPLFANTRFSTDRLSQEFCISIDTVSTKLVDPFFSAVLEDYTKICIFHLSKIIKHIEMPYPVVSRTVILYPFPPKIFLAYWL